MMQNNIKVLGITGGIGSGKSAVLRYISTKKGTYIVEADALAKSLMSCGTELYKDIVDAFGNDILCEDGSFDREKFGKIVFADSEKLKKLNSLVHPSVKNHITGLIKEAKEGTLLNSRDEKISLFVIEAALLIEDGYKKICDKICYIYADRDIRIERLTDGRGYSKEKSISVMNSQKSDDFYKDNTEYLVDNSGDLERTKAYVDDMIMELFG